MNKADLVKEFNEQAEACRRLGLSFVGGRALGTDPVLARREHDIALARETTWRQAANRMERALGPADVWIVGKALEDVPAPRWEFQGVFMTEEEAIAACASDSYFIGPAIVGDRLADETVPWPGSYYPRLEDRNHVPKQ